jgi:hypothetical protein
MGFRVRMDVCGVHSQGRTGSSSNGHGKGQRLGWGSIKRCRSPIKKPAPSRRGQDEVDHRTNLKADGDRRRWCANRASASMRAMRVAGRDVSAFTRVFDALWPAATHKIHRSKSIEMCCIALTRASSPRKAVAGNDRGHDTANRTLALDEADHLRNRVFRRDRDHHVDMIWHEVALLDPAFLLQSQLAEHIPRYCLSSPHSTTCGTWE